MSKGVCLCVCVCMSSWGSVPVHSSGVCAHVAVDRHQLHYVGVPVVGFFCQVR